MAYAARRSGLVLLDNFKRVSSFRTARQPDDINQVRQLTILSSIVDHLLIFLDMLDLGQVLNLAEIVSDAPSGEEEGDT